MIVRTARSAAALAVATLLAAVTALLVLPGIAHAKDHDCRDFATQEDAQAYFDAQSGDPDNLDSNGDGVACETRPHQFVGVATTTTRTTTTTPPVTTTTTTTAPAGSSTATTTTSTTEGTTTSTTSTSTTTTTTSGSDSDSGSNSGSDSDSDADDSSSSATSGDDRDCADFASQADAQAALDAELSDPDHLDADVDGIACEDRFGNAGQQVQVHPSGGVDTGGGPADA
jgi:uncharacterized protein YqkB